MAGDSRNHRLVAAFSSAAGSCFSVGHRDPKRITGSTLARSTRVPVRDLAYFAPAKGVGNTVLVRSRKRRDIGGVQTKGEIMSDAKHTVDRADQERMTKTLHDVATDDVFLNALVEAERDASVRKQFQTDPKAHLKQKGRDIPDDVNVEITDDANSWGARLSMKSKNGATTAVSFRSGTARGTENDPKDRESFRRSSARIRNSMVDDSTVSAIEEALADPVARGKFNADPKGISQVERKRDR